MSSAKEETLSPEELRKRLYKTLRDRGVLNTLKTQLRNQLIQELKPSPLSGAEPSQRAATGRPDYLLFLACNNIVADYLHCSGYEYSLSVFCPESGLCKEKVFKKTDILQLLKISAESSLYKSLSSSSNDSGFLINLVSNLTHHHAPGLHCDAHTQTTSSSSYEESLVEKMKMIDKEYENVSYSGDKWFSFQSKLASYKRELETQTQIEMNTKMQHFKEVEIAKVRMEEKVQCQKEFDKLKQELERTYEMKTKALNIREKNAIERLQKQQEIEEKDIYMQRQMVLKEIDTLRERENELRMRMEAFEKSCEIHGEKVKTSDELMRRRELAVKTMEDTYDQRLKSELSRYQLELKEEYLKRTEQLAVSESRNKEEAIYIKKESATIKLKLDEHNKACLELKQLQVALDASQQQTSLLNQQNDLLQERLESMSDYGSLKEDKAVLQGKVQLLKTQLEEALEEKQRLCAELDKPSKTQLALQAELCKLQSARKMDEEEFTNQKLVLQKQLQLEVERYDQLKALLLESEEKLQWMTAHVEDLKMQIRQTQQALENEVLLNSKPSLVDRSVLNFSSDKLVPPDIYVDRALLRPQAAYDHMSEVEVHTQGNQSHWDDCNSDLEMLAKTNARIQELAREAEALDEACRKYQQGAVPANISNRRAPKPSRRVDSPLLTQATDLFHPYNDRQSKTILRSLSQKTVRTPSAATYDTRNAFTAAQHRVTFSQDQNLKSSGLSAASSHSSTEPQSVGDDLPQGRRSSRRPSSHGRRQRQGAAEEVVLSTFFSDLSHDSYLHSAPHNEVPSSRARELSPELSPPHSPQLQSTARNPHSVPNPPCVSSSSQSSPLPERISIEDLTGISPEPGHIPELPLDTAVPLSEKAPGGPSVLRLQSPPDLPEAPVNSGGQVAHIPKGLEAEEEDEEQRWEKERREKQELRRQEQEEAREREQQEAERLERETLLQQQQQEEEEEEKDGGDEDRGDEGETQAEALNENPLEKYMKIVLDGREKQRDKRSAGEEEHPSPEVKSLSEEKDNSIAAYSHKDEDADDDFW
ncbi:centriole and centriolar satellite protein ofd1 [Nerophis lumbriciformis]|uniref:centriole and centriolar satellite protein ofd1 n=1 Tax=Nerophis lumbriciformis TaxID=546530 RepID=UPI002ADF9912|nr:centriole and centriolar satellite protein ofd1-like [Nerophis lumbriciformis]XP_061827396.1 centriole and centriolar satellite protein ofd1-like [Nerophis lumbriciformis]